ncbi:P-loop containing nucleoside triphosphate hydrolase protein [Staphylotrichum tortipilum]|uniref:P-loop containing nucleoside triphosphate hydrolase protein n=1 Tax=Staphylotrichum tortipilum TaxID=2831512 RepID=A0AAN6MAJ7_9PEZI|nr:P-loop containing nucleoside triphosphate hydrolase protein [Staphylotrichum longicolle]
MGTPHQGGNGVQLGRILANVASLFVAADDRLLKHLEQDSEWLQQQLGQFAPISGDFVTKFAYEEYATPTVLGHSIMVVPRASAVVPGHADAEPIVIHANHTSMVRYPSRQNSGYMTVSENLQIMAMDAKEHVQQRWEREKRVDDGRSNAARFTLSLSLSGVTETSHFIAREEELILMRQVLHTQPGRRTIVVHGLGGMGKTQLAIAYMKRHRNDYSASIWLNARDETSLNQSFRNAARRILQEHPLLSYMQSAVADKDSDASMAVKRWLDEPRNDQWLLIYDNYDHPKMGGDLGATAARDSGSPGRLVEEVDQPVPEGYDIRRYLPDAHQGAVIVTTRSSTVHIGELLRLRKLRNMEDSLRILESTSARKGTQDDAAAVALARKLDGLPLALSTAGTYLAQVSTSWGQYLQDYESAWNQLQKLSPQLLTYENRAMYSTWNISYESIRRRSESAAMLLRFGSTFDSGPKWDRVEWV